MSTRSLVGGLTDSGTYTVYVHFDGYPEGRLPVLERIIQRDGPGKALVTILSAREGGWSMLDHDQSDKKSPALGDRGRIVEGYGVAYTDAPEAVPQKFPEQWDDDSWAEYVYLIADDGTINWAPTSRLVQPGQWNWQAHPVAVATQ